MTPSPHPIGVRRRGRPRASDLAWRDSHVAGVAREVFIALGYAGASIDEIARRSGVAKQTLYSAYGGKAGLFARVVSETAHPAAPERSGASAAEALRAVAEAMVAGPQAQRGIDLLRMIIAETPSQPDLVQPVRDQGRREVLAQVAGIFDDLFDRGLLPRADAEAAAALFVDMVIGSTILNLLSALDEDPRSLVARRTAFFLAGFAAWAATEASEA